MRTIPPQPRHADPPVLHQDHVLAWMAEQVRRVEGEPVRGVRGPTVRPGTVLRMQAMRSEGLTHREVSRRLGVNVGVVATWAGVGRRR